MTMLEALKQEKAEKLKELMWFNVKCAKRDEIMNRLVELDTLINEASRSAV